MVWIPGGTFSMGSDKHYPEDAPNYCRRYHPAARHAEDLDTSTSHLGFRRIIRDYGNATS